MSESCDEVAAALAGGIGRRSGAVANDKMVYNVGKKSVKFAYVPQSAKACGFCCMMASRGFVFSVDAEPKLHNSCSCKLIPETAKHLLDGYDPDAYYTGYKELFEGYRRDKDGNLVPMFRRGYVYDVQAGCSFKRIDVNGEIAYCKRLEKKPGGSIDYGTTPRSEFGAFVDPEAPDLFDSANISHRGNEWRDMYAHHVLSEHGFSVRARALKALDANGGEIDGISLVDIDLDGDLWEVKSLRGSNPSRGIEHGLKEARDRNFRNPYDEEALSGMGPGLPIRVVLNTRYADFDDSDLGRLVARKMVEKGISSVIHVDASGCATIYEP